MGGEGISDEAEQVDERVDVLELGAGANPAPSSTATLDIREDLSYVDYPGINIAIDRWPFADGSVNRVLAHHVLEHVPPDRISHVLGELDRVLAVGGTAEILLPHAGSWAAQTDLTHFGTGGTTPGVAGYFDGSLEQYWPFDWAVDAWVEVSGPGFIRPSLRRTVRIESEVMVHELLKIPFLLSSAVVHVEITKRGECD